MDYLETPSGLKLTDGSIVMLARFGSTKWVVHNGWYTYMGQQYSGWYFCAIPGQTVIPVNEEDLRLLTLVSGGDSSYTPCPPGPYPPAPPCPPGPGPGPCPPPGPAPGCDIPFTHQMAYELDRAWITVDTIAQRNKLNSRLIPNGKVVRVNNVMGVPKYYVYNQVTQTWDEETFGIDTSNFVSLDEVNQVVNTAIQDMDITEKVEEVVDTSTNVQTKVDNIIQETVPDMINQSTEEIHNDVKDLTVQVTNLTQTVEGIPEWTALA